MTDWGIPRTNKIGAVAAAVAVATLSAGPALSVDLVTEDGQSPPSADPVTEDGQFPPGTDPVTEDGQSPPGAVDKGHADTSERVRQLGAWIDRFFADENYEAEINKSWLRIRLDSFSELYTGTDVDARVRLHLKLPTVNKRLRFEILSPSESDDIDRTGGDGTGPRPPNAAEEKTSAAISYVFRALEERSIIARLGLKFDGYTPNPFVGIRYRELVPLNDIWNLRFTQRFRYFSLDGLESRTTIDMERILEENTLFRTSLDGTWLEEQPDYFYSLGFSLFRPLDDHSAVEYYLNNGFRTDPHRLDRITVGFRHREKIWRDWLAFEVAPQVSFPDDRDFKPVPAILLRLEATFGG